MNMFPVKWYVSEYRHLDIQGIVIFQTEVLLSDSPGTCAAKIFHSDKKI